MGRSGDPVPSRRPRPPRRRSQVRGPGGRAELAGAGRVAERPRPGEAALREGWVVGGVDAREGPAGRFVVTERGGEVAARGGEVAAQLEDPRPVDVVGGEASLVLGRERPLDRCGGAWTVALREEEFDQAVRLAAHQRGGQTPLGGVDRVRVLELGDRLVAASRAHQRGAEPPVCVTDVLVLGAEARLLESQGRARVCEARLDLAKADAGDPADLERDGPDVVVGEFDLDEGERALRTIPRARVVACGQAQNGHEGVVRRVDVGRGGVDPAEAGLDERERLAGSASLVEAMHQELQQVDDPRVVGAEESARAGENVAQFVRCGVRTAVGEEE